MGQNKIKQQTDLEYLKEASEVLTKLDLNFRLDSLNVEVIWFRLMEKLEKEWVIKRHTHATYELHLIRLGACMVKLDDHSFIINAGEFYVTKPGEYHEQRSVENQPLVEYCLNFNLSCHDNLDEEAMIIEALLSKSQCKSIKDTEGLLVLFTDSLIEAKSQKLGYFNLIKNNVYQMMMKLGRQLSLNQIEAYEVPVKYRTDEFRLKQIQQYIERNCRSNL
ncbi:MAG: AraC family ligand binding domain-containing protein, partial [Turicibacter sp.]